MNALIRLLRIVVLLLAIFSMTIGIMKLVSVNDTLWLFIGVGFIWLLVLLQIVEKNRPEGILR